MGTLQNKSHKLDNIEKIKKAGTLNTAARIKQLRMQIIPKVNPCWINRQNKIITSPS